MPMGDPRPPRPHALRKPTRDRSKVSRATLAIMIPPKRKSGSAARGAPGKDAPRAAILLAVVRTRHVRTQELQVITQLAVLQLADAVSGERYRRLPRRAAGEPLVHRHQLGLALVPRRLHGERKVDGAAVGNRGQTADLDLLRADL